MGGSSRPAWMEEGLWEHEVRETLGYYPEALLIEVEVRSVLALGWRVVMDPIPPADELHAVLADLEQGFICDVGLRGRIQHSDADCGSMSPDHEVLLPRVRVPRRPYIVELIYPLKLNGGAGPIHPQARVVQPEMTFRTYPRHPHMNGDLRHSWPCPLSPHATTWSWAEGATWSYLAHVALWILKTEAWARTGGGIGRQGTWVGDATPHTPLHVLSTVDPIGPCRCGRGKRYEDCHLALDLNVAVRA